ncbi:MAG: H-type lectin domain-containing protein [Planktomarina sp.]
MRKIGGHLVGIDQGDIILFSDFEDGGPMWVDQGPREVRKSVEFSERYQSIPNVTVAISMWDLDQKSNTRADISAESITRAGFELVFRTWSDTRIARMRASWQSIGEVEDDEAWQLY